VPAKKTTDQTSEIDTAAARGKDAEDVKPVAPEGRWPKLKYHTLRFATRSSLAEVLLIASLAMARYIKNSDFSYPSEIVIDIVLLGVVVSALYYIMKWILRGRLLAAHTAGLFISYACYNFSSSFPRLQHVAERLIPDNFTPFTHNMLTLLFLSIVFMTLGALLDWAVRSQKQLKKVPFVRIAVFVIVFIFVSQLVKVGARVWALRADLLYKPPTVSLQQSAAGKAIKTTDKPNIYYLLFDRYANSTTLKNIYDYDNSDLTGFLNQQGFVTRADAYANYPFTMMSVSSTLSMGYHTDIGAQFKNDAKGFQAAFPYRTLLDRPPVAAALKQNGYEYNQVSSWWDFTRKIPAADSEPTASFELRLFGKSFWLSDLQRDIVNKSILAPLVRKGITFGDTAVIKYRHDRNPVENFDDQMSALKTIAKSSPSHTTPQFTFAHFLSPHDPYIFDETGETPDYDQNRTDIGVDETVKYKNQLTYLNTRIKDLVATIRSQDPSAVIVLQADEGPYPKEFRGKLTSDHYYDPINLELPQMKQKFGVLASYYMPGIDSTTVSKELNANVNAFRFVLDQYLGYELPLLPDCQFTVGDKFALYNYELVTGKLRGGDNPAACKQYK
jgi:hypothetical protein